MIPPDLIFTDIQLPDEDGLTLTGRIKMRHPEVIIAILTAYDSPEYRKAALELHADYFFLRHSVSTMEIITSVLSVLERKGFNGDGSRSSCVVNTQSSRVLVR